MKHLFALAISLCLSGTASADPVAARAAEMRRAYAAWAQVQKIPTPQIVILHKGQITGSTPADTAPIELASLSKAITAVCVASLIDEGRWSAQTTSAEVLGFGHEGITIAKLLNHTAGLSPDSTQSLTEMWSTSTVPRKRIVAETALNRARKGAGNFQYNNENYGILGEMIEVALGQPYATACHRRALAPAGVSTARPSPIMGGMLPWGGWSMSAQDYARFHYHWFGPNGDYATGAPKALAFDVGGGAEYGLGMFERRVADHRNFWHFGLWCVATRLNAGAFAVIWRGEWSAVAVYDKCLDWDAMFALDSALAKVVYAK